MASIGPSAVAFAVRGPIAPGDLAGLCARVCAFLDACGPGTVLCDVGGVEPDAVTADALARLQVAARRRGCQIRLRHASAGLLELLDFMGLSEVLPG